MDFQAFHARFEQACVEVQAPKTRVAGERTITSLLSLPNTLPLCKYIIEHTSNDGTTYQAVSLLMTSATREYALHPRAEMHALLDWLLDLAVARFETQEPFARNRMLQAVAVIFKRGYLEEGVKEKEAFFGRLTSLIGGQRGERLVALSTFAALIGELSSDRATAMGLAYDHHLKSRMLFEEQELRSVFQVVVQLLQHLLRDGLKREERADIELLATCLAIADDILSWDFVNSGDNALQGSFKTERHGQNKQSGRFPASWRDLIIRPDVIDLFFELHYALQIERGLANRTRECLSSLAGVHGPILESIDGNGRVTEDDASQRAYIAHILRNFLKFIVHFVATTPFDSQTDFEPELVGITSMSTKIISTYRLRVIAAVPEFTHFLNELAKLTITCYKSNADAGEDWVVWTQEEGDQLLDIWARLIEQMEEYSEEQAALVTTGQQTQHFDFEGLSKFLAMAAFHIFETYVDTRLEAAQQEVDDVTDNDSIKDDFVYEDQLIAVGIIARLDTARCIAKLQNLIADRLSRIQKLFNEGGPEASELSGIYEELHWLALFSGHILATPGRGETPQVPRAVLALSCSTPSLQHSFGASAGGPAILDFVLSMIQKNFVIWHGQEDLLMQIVSLLSTFSKSLPVRDALLSSEKFQSLIGFFLENLGRLPASVHSPLIENIAVIATHSSAADVRSHYFNNLTGAIEKRLLSVIHNPQFHQNYQRAEIIDHIISTMEVYSGLVLAADEGNTREIFAAVSKYFDTFVRLLDLYRNHTEVEKYVLQIFANLIRCQSFEELTDADCQGLYEAVLALLKTYSKNSVGRKRIARAGDEDELFEDLSCILEILAQLMASQYEGMAWNEILEKRKNSGTTDVADIVFFGINTVIPLITDDMLKFPELSRDYISLVGNLVRYFPDKLFSLPPPLLASLVRALEFGQHAAMAEIARGALETVTTLALYAWDSTARTADESIEFLSPHLDHLMQKCFAMFLFDEFDSGLLEAGGEAIFALVLARTVSKPLLSIIVQNARLTSRSFKQSYGAMTHHLVNQQAQPALAQRLGSALSALHNVIMETVRDPDNADRLRAGRVEGIVSGPWIVPYRKQLEAVLMDVRGFLRVK
ncbi:Exportin-4 [Thoreauomyces humboldtii]|nr:Exportin-4 [Thoreauomyces humboldtii]